MNEFERRYGEFGKYGFNDPHADLGSYYKAKRLDNQRNSAENKQRKLYIQPELHRVTVIKNIDDIFVISDDLISSKSRRDC